MWLRPRSRASAGFAIQSSPPDQGHWILGQSWRSGRGRAPGGTGRRQLNRRGRCHIDGRPVSGVRSGAAAASGGARASGVCRTAWWSISIRRAAVSSCRCPSAPGPGHARDAAMRACASPTRGAPTARRAMSPTVPRRRRGTLCAHGQEIGSADAPHPAGRGTGRCAAARRRLGAGGGAPGRGRFRRGMSAPRRGPHMRYTPNPPRPGGVRPARSSSWASTSRVCSGSTMASHHS